MKHAGPDHPFPGLRPFEFEDRNFFFGRQEHVNTLYDKLLLNRFIAVVGSSGSGKSSLVRAGLLGRLAALDVLESGPIWKTILMRPLGHPLRQLAAALVRNSWTRPRDSDLNQARMMMLAEQRASARLSRSSAGLIELLQEANEDGTGRVLIVVDQFEELFRYVAAQLDTDFDERALFVKHLLSAATDSSLRIHVLITMRSEFIGDCAQFRDLPEAVSDSQFLTPRLTREQRREAIVEPLHLACGKVAPELLQRILNDVGHETDQLPVMQHALMRTWQVASPRRSLTLQDYEQVGGMQSALSMHAEKLLQERTAAEGPPSLRTDLEKRDLERIFRALADVDRDGRATRRPTRFIELAAQCSSPEAAVALIDVFRDEEFAFLSPNKATAIEDDTIIDITHEALIRKWKTLAIWLERETEDGKNILRLYDVSLRRRNDPEFVLGPREAIERNRWWQESRPTATWARRYLKAADDVNFEQIRELLEASVELAARDASLQRQAKEAQVEVERLLRERAEREVHEKENELELARMARKLAEAQRQKLASLVTERSDGVAQSVFVSHARQDRHTALEVYDWLVEQGLEKIHMELDTDPELSSGGHATDDIMSSRAVVLLISQAWAETRYCMRDLEIARGAKKDLVPLVLDPNAESVAKSVVGDFQLTYWYERGARERVRAELGRLGLLQDFFKYVPGRSPYPGLTGFEEEDAAVFFGRSPQIADVVDRLRAFHQQGGCHVLIILGASGSGKSSFLRAGLWTRLKRNAANFFCLPILHPRQWGEAAGGLDPLRALTVALERESILDSRLDGGKTREIREAQSSNDPEGEKLEAVLLDLSHRLTQLESEPASIVFAVDQAEELFRGHHDESLRFLSHRIDALIRRSRVPLIILFSIRSDHFDRFQRDPILGTLKAHIFNLPPIPPNLFRAVIEGPAHVAGLKLEPELVDRLLADVGGADALPILAFILERLYTECGSSGALRLADYESLGGFRGAIETAIERAIAEAQRDPAVPENRASVLKLLRRALVPALVAINPEDGQPRRRIARLSDLPREALPLLEHLVKQRLLVTAIQTGAGGGETVIEVAHEAMLRQWHLLASWLQEDADLLVVLSGVQRAAQEWQRNRRESAWLLPNKRLLEANRLFDRPDFAANLSSSDREYLRASRVRVRRRQLLMVAAASACLVILLGALTVSYERHKATSLALTSTINIQQQVEEGLRNGRISVEGATELLKGALATLKSLDRLDTSSEVTTSRVQALITISDSLFDMGDTSTALSSLKTAEHLAEELASGRNSGSDSRRLLASAIWRIGDIQFSQGDLAEALTQFEAATQIAQTEARANPADKSTQELLAFLHIKVGNVFAAQDEFDAALREYQMSIEISETLMKSNPGSTSSQRNLASALDRRGDVLRQRGEIDGALIAYQESQKIQRLLLGNDPENVVLQRNLSSSFQRIETYCGSMATCPAHLLSSKRAWQSTALLSPRTRAMRNGSWRSRPAWRG
jgi:tetratricopeptide (TPR) repeat protein